MFSISSQFLNLHFRLVLLKQKNDTVQMMAHVEQIPLQMAGHLGVHGISVVSVVVEVIRFPLELV